MGETAVTGNVGETLFKAANAVRNLRSNVIDFMRKISSSDEIAGCNLTAAGRQISPEDREKYYKQEIVSRLQRMVDNLRDLDQAVTGVNPGINAFNLGNTSYVTQESAPNLVALYSQLIDSYKWTDKVKTYSEYACPILSQNSLKRTFFNASISAKRRRTMANCHIAAPEAVNTAILNISNMHSGMDISISRPLGSNAALNITLGQTLKAVVILKGWLIEWVVVRGANEDMTKEDGTLDLWSESRYKVFQKVTDNANAAMLHFCAPNYPELSVRSFMTWLHSYITLFVHPCKKCSLHLCTNMMPPTWRDLRNLEAYHEECKP